MTKITIQLTNHDSHWRADIKELPGSPPCGDGRTKEEAIANLFMRLRSTSGYMNGQSLVLDRCREIEIVEKSSDVIKAGKSCAKGVITEL